MDPTDLDLAVQEEKHSLRGAMRCRLADLDPAERTRRSRALVARLAVLPAWRRSRRVLLFAPAASEPDLDWLWHEGHLVGKEGCYPRVSGQDLIIQQVASLASLQPVPPWNLREPSPEGEPALLGSLDLVLVPGLAFDGQGGRLGRGGGFYDRLLARREAGTPATIGVGFDFQQVQRLPLVLHDARLDGIVVG